MQNVARSTFCDRFLLKCVQATAANEIYGGWASTRSNRSEIQIMPVYLSDKLLNTMLALHNK